MVVTTPIYQVKAEFFKTLGHPARIRVLEVLREGERTVSDLAPAVGIEASHLSQQLAVLRRANLVQARKEGQGPVLGREPHDLRFARRRPSDPHLVSR